MALTGDPQATDPACELSPFHAAMLQVAEGESGGAPPPFTYRRPLKAAPRPAAALATA